MRQAQPSHPALIPKNKAALPPIATPVVRATADILDAHPLAGQNVRLSLSELAGYVGARATYPNTWEARLASALEDAVRNNGGYVEYGEADGLMRGQAMGRDYPEALRESYGALTASCAQESTGWSGWYPKNPTDTKDAAGNTFKFYATPSAAPDQLAAFVAAFPDLVARLEKTAGGKMVGAKLPATFTGFVGLNDRLVVHFYDRSLKETVEKTVREWADGNGIRLMPRTHRWGIDRESGEKPSASNPSVVHPARDAGSFTQRLARKWAQETARLAAQETWTDAQLAAWLAETVRASLKDAEF